MKIFVIGAGGRVATETIAQLKHLGHTVYCGYRRPNTRPQDFQQIPVHFDLHWEVEQMKEAMAGVDAVYFLAGSRGKDLLQTDAFGAVQSMKAAEAAGINRYIMLSSQFSTEPEKWRDNPSLENLRPYCMAKFFADQWLINNTNLNYTIIQPGTLTDSPATGLISTIPDKHEENPIADVAAVLVSVLERENTFRTLIPVVSGDTPIDKALAAITPELS